MPPAEPPLFRVVIPNGPAETAGSTLWNRPRVVPKDLGIAFANEGDGQPVRAKIGEVVLGRITGNTDDTDAGASPRFIHFRQLSFPLLDLAIPITMKCLSLKARP